VSCVLLLVAAGCARPAAPPPRDIPRTVAVLPPHNETGRPLPVAGSSLLERYAFDTRPVTVPDLLASEARLQLASKGFTVVPAYVVAQATDNRTPVSAEAAADLAKGAHLDGAALFVDLRRWDPDPPTEPRIVIVNLVVTLVDPSTGRALWTNSWPTRPVRTVGEVTLGAADIAAARAVIEGVLAPLVPAR
jgi:hypothetical protein